MTDEGRRLVAKLMPEIIDMITTTLEGIPRDELRSFWSVLHKMENKLDLMSNGSAIVD